MSSPVAVRWCEYRGWFVSVQSLLVNVRRLSVVRTLLPAADIHREVARLGEEISRDYPEGTITVIGVLTGCVVFLADLIRELKRPVQIAFVQASSYRGSATRPGELTLDLDGLPDLTGARILLLDDIFDTGRTLAALTSRLRLQKPRSIRTAVLLWKTDRREVDLCPDYWAFQIPDEFVVGYGLDYDGQYRSLRDIVVLEPHDISASADRGAAEPGSSAS